MISFIVAGFLIGFGLRGMLEIYLNRNVEGYRSIYGKWWKK
jgi:hypothetical protein